MASSSSSNKRSAPDQQPGNGNKKAKKSSIDFSNEDKNLSDITLVVDGQRFNVLKGRLGFHSQPLYNMFFGLYQEADRSEIELNGFGAEEFQVFLDILHGEHGLGSNEMVEKVLKIADMYDVELVRRKCEKKIANSSSMSKQKKFELAVNFGLTDLKDTLLSNIQTFTDLVILLPNNLSDLDHSTMTTILEKSLEFNRKNMVAGAPSHRQIRFADFTPAQRVPHPTAPAPAPARARPAAPPVPPPSPYYLQPAYHLPTYNYNQAPPAVVPILEFPMPPVPVASASARAPVAPAPAQDPPALVRVRRRPRRGAAQPE